LQWRQFNFFEKEQIYDPIERSRSPKWLQNMDITSWTNGRGHLIFGDSAGLITLVNYSLNLNYSYPAHPSSITQVKIMKYKNILISVGEDESSVPNIKVWNLDKMNKNTKSPVCLRTIKVNHAGKISPVTSIAILDSMSQMAIGLENGTVILMRGDILRDRFTKTRIIHEGKGAVTGLGFKEEGKQTLLYIVTNSSIYLYNTLVKDYKKLIDEQGCNVGCSVINFHDPFSDLIIGKNEAVYFYNSEGRGPCSIIDCEKYQLLWYRNYLVIVSYDKLNKYKNADDSQFNKHDPTQNEKTMSITIYDLKNKYIAYTESFTEDFIREDQNDINSKFVEKKGAIRCICSEWGSLFIFTGDRKMYRLEEIDLSTKLDILFKRNMYTLAINIVNSQQQYSSTNSNPNLNLEGISTKENQVVQNTINNTEYDYGTLVEIYKRYGDWLYEKSDFDNAMTQYLHTIGQLEPSYVIRKFLDAQRIHNLTSYLQALHEAGLANSDHTTLLLNCYTKLKSEDSLDQFIKSEKNINFDVDTAINVCRQAGYFEHAIYLAEAFKYYDLYINIQVEDLHNYHDVISYMNKLPFKIVENNINRYGIKLVTNIPEHTTELLIKLCTGWDDENEKEFEDVNEEGINKNNGQSLLSHVVSKYKNSKTNNSNSNNGNNKETNGTSTAKMVNEVNETSINNQDMTSFIINNDNSTIDDEKSKMSLNPNQTHLSSFPPFQPENITNNGINIIGSINAATALKNEESFQINASSISNISHSFQSQVNFNLDDDRFNRNNIIDLSTTISPKLEEEKLKGNAQVTFDASNKHVLMANAESFIYLYINQKEWCITFLETVLEKRLNSANENSNNIIIEEDMNDNDNQIIWNTLLELYLSGTTEIFKKSEDYTEDDSIMKWEPLEGKIMDLLCNPKANYDIDHALVLCKAYNFQKGILYLSEKLNLYTTIIRNYFDNENYEEILSTCNKYGDHDPSLWALALSYFASRDNCIHTYLITVLNKIDEKKILSPLEVIQILSKNSSVTIGTVKDYICRNISELKEIEENQTIINNYKKDTEAMRQQIDNLKNGDVIFQVSKCEACGRQLELPTIHFLCKHSYHLRCLGENDHTCPKCAPEHKMIIDAIKLQESNIVNQDILDQQLETSNDHFDTITSYFSKNPFFSMNSGY
jgi:hypothetical protein